MKTCHMIFSCPAQMRALANIICQNTQTKRQGKRVIEHFLAQHKCEHRQTSLAEKPQTTSKMGHTIFPCPTKLRALANTSKHHLPKHNNKTEIMSYEMFMSNTNASTIKQRLLKHPNKQQLIYCLRDTIFDCPASMRALANIICQNTPTKRTRKTCHRKFSCPT